MLQVHLQEATALRYISASYFAFEGLMVNQYEGNMVDCSTGFGAGLVNAATKGFTNNDNCAEAGLHPGGTATTRVGGVEWLPRKK
jgi:hypothetical protein